MALVVAGAALLLGATLLNPAVAPGEAVVGPVALNTLLPAYLLPAALLLGLGRTAGRLAPAMGRALGLAGAAALHAGFAIRHAWRGAEAMAEPGVGDGELYSYTVALLVLGSALLHAGITRGSRPLRLAANAVLVLAIAKVFLVDAAGLEGLARSASFLALGLCLAGLAWLNRRLAPGSTATR